MKAILNYRGKPLPMKSLAALVIASALALACSTEPAGSSGSSTPSLCAPACRSAGVCMASEASGKPRKIDQAGCEKQCALELAGKGYLSVEIATRIFTVLADADSKGGDIECKLGLGGLQFEGDRPPVQDQAYLEQCTAKWSRLCPDTVVDNLRGACFREFYFMNEQIRAELEKCFAATDCIALGICVGETNERLRPTCSPWFGPSGVDCQ
jgi:hypothetical protein